MFHTSVDIIREMQDQLTCIKTDQIYVQPVVAADSHTYERQAIQRWMKHSLRSPLTNQLLKSNQIIQNLLIRQTVRKFNNLLKPLVSQTKKQITKLQQKIIQNKLKIKELSQTNAKGQVIKKIIKAINESKSGLITQQKLQLIVGKHATFNLALQSPQITLLTPHHITTHSIQKTLSQIKKTLSYICLKQQSLQTPAIKLRSQCYLLALSQQLNRQFNIYNTSKPSSNLKTRNLIAQYIGRMDLIQKSEEFQIGEGDKDRARQKADIFGQIDKIIKEMTQTPKAYQKIWLIQGVPGGGKGSGILKRIVMVLKGMMKDKEQWTQNQVIVYGTAPFDGGIQGLKEVKDTAKGIVSTIDKVMEMIEKTKNDGKTKVLVVDQIYTISQEKLLKVLNLAKQQDLILIFCGDSLQNLPSLSVCGFFQRDAFSKISVRSKDKQLVKFPQTVVSADNLKQGFKQGLQLFSSYMQTFPSTQSACISLVLKCLSQLSPTPSYLQFVLITHKSYTTYLNNLFQSIRIKSFNQEQKVLLGNISMEIGIGALLMFIDGWGEFKKGEVVRLARKGLQWGVRRSQVEVSFNKINEDLEKANKDLKKETDIKKIQLLNQKIQGYKSNIQQLNNSQLTPLTPQAMKSLTLAYARNSMDSQGMTVDKSYIFITPDMDMAQVYVALTRAEGRSKGKRKTSNGKEQTNQIYISASQQLWHDESSIQGIINHSWIDQNSQAIENIRYFLSQQ